MSLNFHILLVEDSRADVMICERALAEGNVPHRLTVLPDGRQALDYFTRLQGPLATPDLLPDLVLLDLNLPGIDGYEVLGRIKNAPELKALPVVVLTTSRRDEDVRQTYQAGANTFIQKPSEYPRYRDLVKTLESYWLVTALRPRLRHP